MNREVIRIEEPQEGKKPVEFMHYLNGEKGWEGTDDNPSDYDKVVYIGLCNVDGDMFAGYDDKTICIFKGHLNSGKY